MKKINIILVSLLAALFFVGCSDDDKPSEGNPQMDVLTEFSSAMFADSLSFQIAVQDEVPLSTLKAFLYFDTELVAEKVIRTKENGTYEGKLYIPFYKDIPNGTAKLEFVLQNTSLTKVAESYDLSLTRPLYEELFLVTNDGEIALSRVEGYDYEVTDNFPKNVTGYLRAPSMGADNNEVTFGMEGSDIVVGSTSPIEFSHYTEEWTIKFNTFTFDVGPFEAGLFLNDVMFQPNIGERNRWGVEVELKKGDNIEISGIDNLADWWIDSDFFTKIDDNNFTFVPIDGKYRIMADFVGQFFVIEVMSGDELASLQDDGSGAIWVIGNNFRKPDMGDAGQDWIGWTTEDAVCMSPVGDKVYQMTLVAGEQMSEYSLDFKFFHQKGWGGEYGHSTLTLVEGGELIFIGDGTDQEGINRGDGNLGLRQDVELEVGAAYIFTIDVTEGRESAKLHFVKK